jgi:superfamily I DNA and/or RNA helicase/very-short-patch-repair endonuclease
MEQAKMDRPPETNIIKFPNSQGKLLANLAVYFRDFLDTGFKKEGKPKRKITIKDKDGRLTGSTLHRYSQFQHELWAKLAEPVSVVLSMDVTRGRYTMPLNQQLSDLLTKHISAIRKEDLQELADKLNEQARFLLAQEDKNRLDAILAYTLNETERTLIFPLLERIAASIIEASVKGIEDIFETQQELVELLVGQAEDAIRAGLNTAIIDRKMDEFESAIAELTDETAVKIKLQGYFDNFSAGDLYNELLDLNNSRKQKENTQIYLHIGHIKYEGFTYPLTYLPIEIVLKENKITLEANPHLYLNKRAIDYVAQQVAEKQQIPKPASLIKERICYLAPDQSVLAVVQSLFDSWSNALLIRPPLDLTNPKKQTSKSSLTVTTNDLSLSVYDQSEESLLNDYETLLSLSESDSLIFKTFASIVDGFMNKEPQSFMIPIETSWDKTAFEGRLVYDSPVPLNEEQRKIINATNERGCKVISISGPPGTGKSHTITAIAFDAILKNKSILILSDKKEALDVVQDKLTQTVNRVRMDDDFQNPILRLGQNASTYNKIFSASSMEKIKQQHLAARAKHNELKSEIISKSAKLRTELTTAKKQAENINLQDMIDFDRIEQKLEKVNPELVEPLQESHIPKTIDFINGLRNCVREANSEWLTAVKISFKAVNLNILLHALKAQDYIDKIRNNKDFTCESFTLFNQFEHEHVIKLGEYIARYLGIRMPVFGFFFSRSKARLIDTQITQDLDLSLAMDIHKKLDQLQSALQGITVIYSVLKREEKLSWFKLIFNQLRDGVLVSKEAREKLLPLLECAHNAISDHPEILAKIGIKHSNLDQWLFDPSAEQQILMELVTEYVNRFSTISKQFNELPQIDYATDKQELELLHTKRLANIIDERVVNFTEEHRTLAQTMKKIIAAKQQFPKDKFDAIKQSFPVIIASLREYSEYVPLEANLFDIVLIDEASQVSISQALPAMIRAKKLIVLGDQHQFSNVKTSQASKSTNEQYLSEIKANFMKERGSEIDTNILTRLALFNIKTSVLTFADSVANYKTVLKKHFRGYPELIAFSSDTFYGGHLQAVKLRGKTIDDVLRFHEVEHDGLKALINNTNPLECKAIIRELEKLVAVDEPPSVAIITPHTQQQAYISREIHKHEFAHEFDSKLHLKIFTFDSCQGEERDVIMYSMVASEQNDKLWAIFPKSIAAAGDVEEVLRLQRLNVGFSRAKERIEFFISKPIEKFDNAIGEALRFFDRQLKVAQVFPEIDQVDPNSPMEAKMLNWLKQTDFIQKYHHQVTLVPQFPIGEYLRQLDPDYTHPDYRVDFLLTFRAAEHTVQIVLEYDGFTEHFRELENVNATNYKQYYKAEDIEREKIIESYGYHIIRVNRFNVGKDPVKMLSHRLNKLIKQVTYGNVENAVIREMNHMAEKQANGEMKICPKCEHLRSIKDFYNSELKSGMARHCRLCKG